MSTTRVSLSVDLAHFLSLASEFLLLFVFFLFATLESVYAEKLAGSLACCCTLIRFLHFEPGQ